MSQPRRGVASEPLTKRQGRARRRRILRFAARHLASAWWFELTLPRIGLRRVTERTRTRRMRTVARQFGVLALDLGGLMIKLGQFLSTRLDVLPPEITKELENLQDEVPPVPFEAMRALAEVELGVPLDVAFASIDPAPLAAASLGQVHRARLTVGDAELTGFTDVVVKLQRPGIDGIVAIDISALERVALWLSRIRLVNRRADAPALMAEFAETCRQEIDYLNEAANAERFADDFADNPRVRVPAMVWERSTRRVLTQEDVSDIKISDLAALKAAGIDPAEVASEFASVMFDQIFVNGYFHADPHPGNLFVQPLPDAREGEQRWRLTFIDFGMMGEVPSNLRRALRSTLIAAASRDGAGMVASMQDVGVLLPSADTFELERAMTHAFDRFGGLGFAELQRVDPREYLAFAREFGDIVRALPFQFPENFLLVLRSLSLTSGMCSTLNPAFNIWDAVEPYSARLIRAEGGNVVQEFARDAASTLALVARLPKRLNSLLTRAESGQLAVRSPELEKRAGAIDRTLRRVISAVVFTAFFLGGILIVGQLPLAGVTMLVVSGIPLVHALFADVLSRR